MVQFYPDRTWTLIHGSAPTALELVADRSVHAVVCSPPYYRQRDYDPDTPDWLQLGTEDEPEEFVSHLADCFDPLLDRILRPDGGLWVVIGDTYAGSGGPGGDHNPGGLRAGQPGYSGSARPSARRDPRLGHDRLDGGVTGRSGRGSGSTSLHKPKDLIGVPWLFAQEMKRRGWFWRADVIWSKPNPRPEGPADRPANAHEYVWLFTPSPTTWWDHYAIQEPAVAKTIRANGETVVLAHPKRLRRSVWDLPVSSGYRSATNAHYATYPVDLAYRCLAALTSEIGVCPDCGAQPRRRTRRDRTTRQLISLGWEPPPCGHTDPSQALAGLVGATVADIFSGVASTGLAALRTGRSYLGVEPVAGYVAESEVRLREGAPASTHARARTLRHPSGLSRVGE